MIFGSDGDNEESTAISLTLGGGMSASSSEEAVDKLSEMFPNESRKELENCLKVQGSLDQAVMALLNPCTSTFSSDESELMDSAFHTPDSVKSNVEEALKGVTVTDCSLQMKHVIEKVMNTCN